jgi:hypothetical protein
MGIITGWLKNPTDKMWYPQKMFPSQIFLIRGLPAHQGDEQDKQ